MSKDYSVRLTGGQLRVLHETLAMVMNDPDWSEQFSPREWSMLQRGRDAIINKWREALAAESTPVSGPK